MRTVKCPKCSALYEAISAERAREVMSADYAKTTRKGGTQVVEMESFLDCFHCATPSSSFVDAPIEECPPGCTLAQIVLPEPVQTKSATALGSPEKGSNFLDLPSPHEPKRFGTHYLVVPTEMIGYAKHHGARFDGGKREFYVVGDVPAELFNFLPREAPKAKPHVVAPMCPICTFHMVLITNTKSGSWFYKCAQRFVRNCRGTVDYERHLKSVGQATDGSAFSAFASSQENGTAVVKAKSVPKASLTMTHKIAVAEIAQLGVEILGSSASFKSWLESPKTALGKRSPLEEMRTLEGCEKVNALLRAME
jgi:hypothetical protein